MKKIILILVIIFLLLGASFVSSTYTITKDTHTNNQPIESIDISKETVSRENRAYAFVVYPGPEGPCYFDLDNPETLTSFDILNSPDFCCGTWTNNGKWLVCDETGALWEINLCNNTASLIGGGGVSLTGLSYNPMNDKLYGCSESDLYEINMSTGEQTYIGSFGLSDITIIAIAINMEGRAFIWNILFSGSSTLWEVDLETGETIEIGSMGQNLCYAQDGAFDWETGILYLAAYSSYGFLATCDIETGELTPIGNFEDGSELCALAIPHSDDFCPPITTISLDPPTPDGDNGWYVSGVNITLNATDDMSGVKGIYYRIDENEWIYNSGDYVLFLIDYDCLEGFIEYYSVDFAGNQEETRSIGIDMDQLPPEFNEKYDKQKINDSWLFIFNFSCWDNCSGVDRVEFLLNGVLQDTVTGPGPEYVWQFLYTGGLKITITMVACDIAGNCVSSDLKINFNRNSMQQSTPLLLQFLDHFPLLNRLLYVWGYKLV